MNYNKKFGLIFAFFVILPLFLAFLNYYLANFNKYKWGYDNINEVSQAALAICILGCIYIIYKNHQTSLKSNLWYILSSAFGISFLIYFYIIYSLSHFGF